MTLAQYVSIAKAAEAVMNAAPPWRWEAEKAVTARAWANVAWAAEAEGDDKIVAITAAMPSGTSLKYLEQALPGQYYDVERPIAEHERMDLHVPAGGPCAGPAVRPDERLAARDSSTAPASVAICASAALRRARASASGCTSVRMSTNPSSPSWKAARTGLSSDSRATSLAKAGTGQPVPALLRLRADR